ncbi:MAG: hemolysin family protein [Vicinamibacterales bacterium]
MTTIGIEIGIILALLLANGAFALSEIAIVSARRTRLSALAARGDRRAGAALTLAESPARFLSAVQVGITLIGILSGAFGGATIAEGLEARLATSPAVAPYAEFVAVGIVVVILAFASVVIGELVPKRVALSGPERFARLMALPMARLARMASPLVSLLEWTSDGLMTILRLPRGHDTAVTEADVTAMIRAGTESGVFEPAERRMVEQVLRLDDERVPAIMTPRREIVWLDITAPLDTTLGLVRQYPFSRFPVGDGTLDRLLGVVHVRDLWPLQAPAGATSALLCGLIREPLLVPESAVALDVIERFRAGPMHMAIVVDEHGSVDGLLTLNNLLLFVLGVPPAHVEPAQGAERGRDTPLMVLRDTDSWLVDGSMSVSDLRVALEVHEPEAEDSWAFHTLAGLVMARLGRIPVEGDRLTWNGFDLEVADMDHFRVDKVIVTRRGRTEEGDASAS